MSTRDDSDREKFQRALGEIVQGDPTLGIATASTGALTFLSGMSEARLEAVCDQISREFQIELRVGEPNVIYLETIRRTSEAEGKYIRQVGGHGNYGHVKLRLEPGDSGSGYHFVNETNESQISPEFIEPANLGILEAARRGILAGCELVDLRVVLYDGSCHAEDSNETAFRFAGSMAFKEAARKASPIVLEPIMSIEIAVPEKYLSELVGSLSRRRGRIEATECRDGSVTIQALVPLAEVLRSSKHGLANYPMRFAGYEPAPPEGWNSGDEAGVTANKPDGPRTRRGFTSVRPEAESE